MSDVHTIKDEHYFEDLVGVAAFGHLTDEEQMEFDAYLLRNDAAREEFAELLAVVSLLPLSLDEQAPSAGLRDRIAKAVGAGSGELAPPKLTVISSDPADTSSASNVTWLSSRTGKALVAAAAVMLIAVAAIAIALNMRGTEAEDIDIGTLPAGVNGSLEYRPDDDTFVFDSDGMPAAPENQVYQVWLIPADGDPESVGIMSDGEIEVEAERDEYAAFAITVEAGPDGSTQGPTTDPIVVATLKS